MIKLYEDTAKRFFIYDDVIDTNIFDIITNEIIDQKSEGNQSVRFAVTNNITNTTFGIYQKFYKDFTDIEKEMFHKNYDIDTDYELLRRDSDIMLSNQTRETITKNIHNLIKEIYNNKNIEIEYESVIEYGPGYLMRIHSDTSPGNSRLCTAVLYCTDMQEGDIGGDVLFYDDETGKNIIYTYKPKKNQLVIFDSYYNTPGISHSVTKIENWNRYVYRIYFKDPNRKNELI
jgi:Rps23 Pro-64 3,4-dihydroxylase Tpa1-like proline 4-hydroxylase